MSIVLDREGLDGDVLGLLGRVEVRESDMEPSVCALRFHLRQQENGEFHPIDGGIFAEAMPLGVSLAAPGGNPVPLFNGFITHVRPHFEGIESNCYLEILAMDGATILDAHERVATYPDATDSDAFLAVLGRYDGFTGKADATSARNHEDTHLLVQRGSDWRFVTMLARRNGFRCYFEHDEQTSEDVCHFVKPTLEDPPQADLTILREGANLVWLDLQHVMTGPVRHVGVGVDPIRKILIEAGGQRNRDPMGDGMAADLIERALAAAGADGAVGLLRDPAPVEAILTAAGTAESDADAMVIEARGELDPALYRGLLRARRPVLLKGVGRTYAGVYWVRAVRTTLAEGRLSQTFIAERNAVGLTGREEFGQSAEEVPPE
ncbi:MAG TPA: hypothetical protein VNM90_01350 [Haliangium sp.]|nr:hypothetical protein [Haliangium sp.]